MFLAAATFVLGVSLHLRLDCLQFFTASDMLRVALAWLAPLIALASVHAVGHVMAKAILGASRPQAPPQQPKGRVSRLIAFVLSASVFYPVVCIALFLWIVRSQPHLPVPYMALGLAAMLAWQGIFSAYEKKMKLHLSRSSWLASYFGPAVLFFAFFYGIDRAEQASSPDARSSRSVILKHSGRLEKMSLIFVLDNYVIAVAHPGATVVVLPASSVEQIELWK